MMGITVHMAGAEDLEGPWNIVLAGPGGSGKSLFASTAPEGLFVFFREEPTLKSIAHRAPQYVKLLNEFDAEGSMLMAAHEKLQAILAYIHLHPDAYKTLVIDTGDELFSLIKQARIARQGGEFSGGDWDWLADTWREMLEALTAVPIDVIMLLHTKTQRTEEFAYRELMLQGKAVDETATWFDVVGALDTFQTADEAGNSVVRRMILTHSSRQYPWVVDRSGNLPHHFEISADFVGDYERFKSLLISTPVLKHSAEEVGQIAVEMVEEIKSGAEVPTPEELEDFKGRPRTTEDVLRNTVEEETMGLQVDPKADDAQGHQPSSEAVETDAEAPIPSPEEEPSTQREERLTAQSPVQEAEAQGEQPATVDEALANVEELLNAVEVTVCSHEGCNAEVDDDMKEISEIRFGKSLCRDHFKAAQQS